MVKVIFVVVVALFVIGWLAQRSENKKAKPSKTSGGAPTPEAQAMLMNAVMVKASSFDRDMYIDDMTQDQLKDEFVYRTIYILYSWMTRRKIDQGVMTIAELVTGRPGDKQLTGLSEYYVDTEYEQMNAHGDDRYWDEALIPLADELGFQKKSEIILGGLVVDAVYALRRSQGVPQDYFYCPDIMEICMTDLERVAGEYFGFETETMLATLRTRAAELAQEAVPKLEM